jgi:TRAP-type C4-dicarboxylate transport system permease small subunit
LALAWLTLLAAAIGVRQRSHFTLHVWVHRWSPPMQRALDVFHHACIALFGVVVAWYGWGLSQLNASLSSPGLQINMAWLYASSVVGGLLLCLYAVSMMFQPTDISQGHA